MLKQSKSELKMFSPEGQTTESAFVFPNAYTLAVYEGLRGCCAGEIQRLLAEAAAEAKADSGDGDVSDILESKIEDWIGENVPLMVSCWGFFVNVIYGVLLSLALEQVDFAIVAKAFLEDLVV